MNNLEDKIKRLSALLEEYLMTIVDKILAESDKLVKAAEEVIDKLRRENKTTSIDYFHQLIIKVHVSESSVRSDLITVYGEKQLADDMKKLKKAKEILEKAMKAYSVKYFDEEFKDEVLIECQKLEIEAQEVVDKLKKKGKAKSAEGVRVIEKNLIDIETQLKSLNPKTEFGKSLLRSQRIIWKLRTKNLA